MPWEPRRNARSREWRPRRNRPAGRLRLPFWAGWVALIAGGASFYLVLNPTLWFSMAQESTYQCRRNAYNCNDFRTLIEAQTAYQACGGLGSDVHALDEDRDGLACEFLPLFPWISGY
jgi:Excalibur calcium-binding domain